MNDQTQPVPDAEVAKAEQIKRLKAELDAVGTAHDLLKLGIFQGAQAELLVKSITYLKILHEAFLKEIRKHEPQFGMPEAVEAEIVNPGK